MGKTVIQLGLPSDLDTFVKNIKKFEKMFYDREYSDEEIGFIEWQLARAKVIALAQFLVGRMPSEESIGFCKINKDKINNYDIQKIIKLGKQITEEENFDINASSLIEFDENDEVIQSVLFTDLSYFDLANKCIKLPKNYLELLNEIDEVLYPEVLVVDNEVQVQQVDDTKIVAKEQQVDDTKSVAKVQQVDDTKSVAKKQRYEGRILGIKEAVIKVMENGVNFCGKNGRIFCGGISLSNENDTSENAAPGDDTQGDAR